MADKIRWGIVGTGNIASRLAEALPFVPEAQLMAVGSRSQASADRFGVRFNVPHRHASYEALAVDPDVDVVYVATPHPFHYENSLLCLEAGKAVLCEKPFALNTREAAAMVGLARSRGLFLMEAMWTRFVPAVVKLRQLLAEGAIGDLRMMVADLGFQFEVNLEGRLYNPNLGGGALLDVGVYPISFVSMVLGGPPNQITSLAHLGRTGVDEEAGIVLGYEGGRVAVVYTAMTVPTPSEVILMGSTGNIRVHSPIYCPSRLTISRAGRPDEVIEVPYLGNGYNYEAAEVMACLRAGQRESKIMPLAETLTIMQTMDQIRAQWGLRYPME